MAGHALPRRLFSWVRRWWLGRFAPRRRPLVRYLVPTLVQLEQRNPASAIVLGAQTQPALPPQIAQLDSLMRSASGDSRANSDSGGATASEQIELVSSPSPVQSADNSAPANPPPPEQPWTFGSPPSSAEFMPLDDLFGPSSARRASGFTSPPRPQGNENAANAQALAGGGAPSLGGSSPGLGGGSGGGGGAANGANPNQLLNMYLSMVGSALTPAAAPASAAAAPPTSGAAAPLAAVAPAAQTQATAAPQTPVLTAATPTAPRHHRPGHDPLFVLDMNTGETIPANVTLNTFSSWNENLQAQVSGATVMSYSWDTSGAPDLTNISGQSTFNLQGTWANFTLPLGTTKTELVTVTETAVGGAQLSQTIFFQVAGTNSPAFSSRPTVTWPNVITPDQVAMDQATMEGGPYASLGLADGSVQTSFTLPSYNPGVAPLGLVYNSAAANPQPIFLVHYQLSPTQPVPSTITAQLTLNGPASLPIVYDTSSLNPGDWIQIALQGNATSLATGRYPWQINITDGVSNPAYNGSVDIVNRASSPYGAGWWPDDVEQLFPVLGIAGASRLPGAPAGVILVEPDGTSLWFANQNGTFARPAGDLSTQTLVQNQDGTYTRTLTDDTKINFDSAGRQTSVVDRDGNTTSFGYTNGLLTSITDFNLQQLTLSYNASNQLATITDPATRTTTLGYTGSQLTSITDPAKELWQYGYDSANDLRTLTDPNTKTTTFAYNFADRAAGVTRADYSTEGLSAEQMNGLASAGTTTATLLAVGDQATYFDPNNQPWTTGLDWLGFGLDLQDSDPLSDTTLIYRDGNGLPWLTSDPLARRTREFFDGNGNPTTVVAPDDATQQYQYNQQFNEVTLYTDQAGHLTTYTYDPGNGDLLQVTDSPDGIAMLSTTYSHNSNGFVTGVTDPNHHPITYTYDSLNRMTGVTDTLGDHTTYEYDTAGNLATLTNALTYQTTYGYDAVNRLTNVTDPDGGLTTYGYDGVGNVTSVIDPVGNATTYTYDAVNRLTMQQRLNSQGQPISQTFGYDPADNLTSQTDWNGKTTTFGYDMADRLTGETWVGGSYTATYGYDQASELMTAQDPFSTYHYGYNKNGLLTSIDNAGTPGAPQVTLTYGYDNVQRLSSVTDNRGGTVGYGYDNIDRLTSLGLSVNRQLDAQVTFGFDPASRLTGITRTAPHAMNSDTITSTLSYDNADRLTNITHTDATKSLTLASYTYGYDPANRLTTYQDANNSSLTYGYDHADELTSVSGTLNGQSYSESYSFDKNGNRNMPNYSTGKDNALLSDGTYSYTYDNEGNTLTQTNILTGAVTTYTWDYRNRLTEVQTPGGTETFTYDVNNNRIGMLVNGTQTWTVFDGANPYMDFNSSGTATRRYLTDPRGLNQFYARVNPDGTAVNWYLTDNLNSVRQIVDAGGNVQDALTYSSFGSLLSETNATVGGRFKYAGGAYDSIRGNYQFGARYYNPMDGRFLSEDPESFGTGDANLYRYVFNNPTSNTDPTGLQNMGGSPLGVPWQHFNPQYRADLPKPLIPLPGSWACTGSVGILRPGYFPKSFPKNLKVRPNETNRNQNCQAQWEADLARCARIAAEMKRRGYTGKEIAEWVFACHARAEGRKARCEHGLPATLPPRRAPWE